MLQQYHFYLKACREDSDTVFALDASGSIGQPNFMRQTTFLEVGYDDFRLHSI